MESESQASTEIKIAPSQYQNPLNDDDLVDMNEIIQCNLDNWNLCADTEPVLQCSQEIKLESYNFLGNRINYEDDKFELDAFSLPENYFKVEELNQCESEGENDQRTNGDHEIIDIADDDEDDVAVVDLLNSSNETQNASNVSISANLESFRSDRNYSSQEVFVGSQNEHTETPEAPEPVPHYEPLNEPVDHVNEIQALIASWMNDASSENKAIILNDLENEIKRIKSSMMLDSQTSEDVIRPCANSTAPVDLNTTNVSDDIENDSYNIMSEGHSEQLEYRTGRVVDETVNDRIALTEDEIVSYHVDEETIKTFKNLRLVVENISTKVKSFSKLLTNETFPGETAKTGLIDLSNSGQELTESIKAMAATLKIEMDISVNNAANSSENENVDIAQLSINDPIDGQTAEVANDPIDGQTAEVANDPIDGQSAEVANDPIDGQIAEVANDPIDGQIAEVAGKNANEVSALYDLGTRMIQFTVMFTCGRNLSLS